MLAPTAKSGVWTLSGGDVQASFAETLRRDGTVHLVSVDFDTDAAAVALLSLSGNGQILISVHGYFPALSHGTYTGTCKAEAQ